MSTFKTNPWGINQLLSLMDSRKIVLPEFQRSFVWWPKDIDLLITSLVQDYPAGSLLFLRADGTNELAWRKSEGVPDNGDVTPDYLVLDGQQRLTSLSLALNGRGDHVFLMDIQLLEQDDLENGIYPLRRKDAEKKGLFERETQFETHTYPVWLATGTNADDWWFQDYAQHHAERARRSRGAARAREANPSEVRETAGGILLPGGGTAIGHESRGGLPDLRDLNKTGMKLTVFDLLTAKFWPQGIKLRELLESAQDEYPLLGEDEFNVDATFLMQAVSLLRSGVCKRGDLLKLSPDGFEEDWWNVCRGASAALTMLKGECGVLGRNWLPYGALFPSLFALATKVLDLPGPAEGAGWEKLRRWFLRRSRRPLTAREIVHAAVKAGLIVTRGRTPEATMSAALYVGASQTLFSSNTRCRVASAQCAGACAGRFGAPRSAPQPRRDPLTSSRSPPENAPDALPAQFMPND